MKNAKRIFQIWLNELITRFNQIIGMQYVSIKNYENLQGEISNYVINFGVSVANAKKRDLIKLRNFDISTLIGFNPELLLKAHTTLIEAAIKNLNSDLSKRSNQSQAQTDSYVNLNDKGTIKMHLDSKEIFAFGLRQSKTILVAGNYEDKPDTRSDLTKAKDAIRKAANLTANKYRLFNLGTIENIKINGTELSILK